MLDIIPAKTIAADNRPFGIFESNFFIDAENKPVHSATPTPNIATRTVPKGANTVKFSTAELKIWIIPIAFNKEIAYTVTYSCSVLKKKITYTTNETYKKDKKKIIAAKKHT